LLFHLGRLGAFFFLGGFLGAIGGEINISGNFISTYSIIIAVVMLWLGLNILGFVPSLANSGIRFPKALTINWAKLRSSENRMAPLFLGALSFFLPCGFTQSMQIFALASGSFWTGGLSLFLFALGTMPVLLILGVTTSFTKDKGLDIAKKVAGILVVIFAIFTFNSGLSLIGAKNIIFSSSINSSSKYIPDNQINNSNINDVPLDKNVQAVKMHVTNSGYAPSVIHIQKGKPVRWMIYGDQVSSCTSKIIVPSLNISQDISRGRNVITFTPDKAGEIPFSCWMGMVRGKFIVE
jgi:sulfite exporter TauE/SafE